MFSSLFPNTPADPLFLHHVLFKQPRERFVFKMRSEPTSQARNGIVPTAPALKPPHSIALLCHPHGDVLLIAYHWHPLPAAALGSRPWFAGQEESCWCKSKAASLSQWGRAKFTRKSWSCISGSKRHIFLTDVCSQLLAITRRRQKSWQSKAAIANLPWLMQA